MRDGGLPTAVWYWVQVAPGGGLNCVFAESRIVSRSGRLNDLNHVSPHATTVRNHLSRRCKHPPNRDAQVYV